MLPVVKGGAVAAVNPGAGFQARAIDGGVEAQSPASPGASSEAETCH
jgi:hypothetical protein